MKGYGYYSYILAIKDSGCAALNDHKQLNNRDLEILIRELNKKTKSIF